MDTIELFQDHFGMKCVGVKFFEGEIDTSNLQILRDIKFCQAVRIAYDQPVLLDKDSISCKGAQYALGFEEGTEKEIANAIKLKRGISKETAEQLVENIPRIKNAHYKYIGLNIENPDILIFYMIPKRFMEFLKIYQRTGNSLEVRLSSITAMCGDVAVQTFLTKRICISFGCDDSREYGEVADEELIVGIPKEKIEEIMRIIC
ncbi:MAG: hypothetical protein AMJ42_06310 [Deltaproteobacteria bacterium DG_8]|nr:MAG: hypothetical protein AMJ42_06310 [Deltaproteobacteria bacterium DG_8]